MNPQSTERAAQCEAEELAAVVVVLHMLRAPEVVPKEPDATPVWRFSGRHRQSGRGFA